MILTTDKGNLFLTVRNKLYQVNLDSQDVKFIEIPQEANLEEKNKNIGEKNPEIACITAEFEHVAVCSTNKNLFLYNSNLDLLKKWKINRAASSVCLVKSLKIVVADKTGDVYIYELNEEKPKLILGHLSIILDMKLSLCGKFILTGDRDEKIRVSFFPNAYNINSYCLGHEEFITNIKIIDSTTILSSSGDGTIRFWNFLSGTELFTINVNEYLTDKSVISTFLSEINSLNIKANALPVVLVDLSIQNLNCLHIVTVLHKLDELFIFEVEKLEQNFKCNLLQTIKCKEKIFSVVFLNNFLYILLKNNLQCFHYKNSEKQYILSENEFLTNVVNERLKSVETENNDSSIFLLYKRSFDNLQDYQSRKKMRLEGSTSE